MRKQLVIAAAAAVGLVAFCLPNRSDAMTAGDPTGIRATIQDVQVTDQVHCRPGWPHHRFRPYNGCFRRGFVVGPRIYVGPRYRYAPRFRRGFRY